MKLRFCILGLGLVVSLVGSLAAAESGLKPSEDPYQPNWLSLAAHPTPDWFRDAKFGIYFHWGPYSVPAWDTEWYSRNMYLPRSPAHKHHLKTYGAIDEFGYKDFIPRFTAEKFDADAWADLFTEAGAKFAGPVGEHADGFAMWDTKYSRWNSVAMGPHRDVVAEMERAVRKRGLKFIVTFHHHWLWGWYPTWDPSADTSNPQFAGLYGPKLPPSAWGTPNPNHPNPNKRGIDVMRPDPMPSEEFCRVWRAKVQEVIDKYQPDLLWFDARMNIIREEDRIGFLAYYYNAAARWGRPVAVTYKFEDLARGTAILDLERARLSQKADFPWLTDDSIDWKSWCHIQDPDYKSTKRIVDELVDIVSKNGCLLLNVTPTAQGEIPGPVVDRLREIGRWLRINGEAIYGTRPWSSFGEGPTQIVEGHLNERENKDFTAEDIRFTTKGDALYALVMGWPEGGRARIASLALGRAEEVASLSMLGHAGNLEWTQSDKALLVTLPDPPPCDHCYALKITFKRCP